MDYQSLWQGVNEGKLTSVYFLFGEEVYLIDMLVRKIIEKGTEPETRDFNCDILQGEQADGETVVGMASSFPMMTDRRVVVLKSVQKLSPSDKKRVLEYVQRPLESTCLVLTAGKVDLRQSFYGSLTKYSQWVDCKNLYENQAVEWIKKQLHEKGITISHDGATLLVQQVGTSLWSLFNEIEKLLTFSWSKKNLGLEEVASVVGFSRKFNTWELTDAVGRRDLKDALSILKRLMDGGQSAVGMIMELSRRIFLLMRIRAMIDGGLSRDEVSRTLNLRPYFKKLYMNQVQRFTSEELELAMKILLRADLYLKTGYLQPSMALTLTIHDLVRVGSDRRFYGLL